MKKIADSDVRWGVLGVGDVCEVKSAPAMNKIEHSSLVAVMRRTTEKAKDYAKRHQVPTWYDDADELINDPDINAIYIATPPNAHESGWAGTGVFTFLILRFTPCGVLA